MSGNNVVYQRDINNRGEPVAQRSQNGAAFVTMVDPGTGAPATGATSTSDGVDRSKTTSTTSSLLMAANSARRGVFIVNDTAIDVWINFGATAVAAAGGGNIKIAAAGGKYESGAFTPSTAINIIAASGTPAITAREFIAVAVGVADAPVIGTATAGRESASVAFTAGASNGGYTVQDYLLSAYDSATNVRYAQFTANSSPALAAIPAGVSSYFKVQARTANGFSALSGASNAISALQPFAAPGAPTGVTATGGGGTVSVTYTAPSLDGGSTITSYRSTLYRVSDGAVMDVVSGTGTLTHSGLTGEYQAYSRVDAANIPEGYGQQSAPSAIVSVTPYIGPVTSRNRQPNYNTATTTIKEMMFWSFRDFVETIPAGETIYFDYTNCVGPNETLGVGRDASADIKSYIRNSPNTTGASVQFLCNGNAVGQLAAEKSRITFEGTLPYDVVAGTRMWIGTYAVFTGTDAVHSTDYANRTTAWRDSTGESVSFSLTPGAVTDTGMTGVRITNVGDSISGFGLSPCAVRSRTTKPTIAIIGDSQERGSALVLPTNPIDGLVGLAERRYKGYGTINVAVSGDSYALALVSNNFNVRPLIAAGTTHVHDGYGDNDGSLTWTNLSTQYIPQMKAKFPGCKYGHVTYDPKATSTDYYSTVGNQTAIAGWANQNSINIQLRAAVPALLDFLADDAALLENTIGSALGVSKVSPNTVVTTYTGTLPAGQGYIDMPPGTFNLATHENQKIVIKGAGTAGADLNVWMAYVSDTRVNFRFISGTAFGTRTIVTAVTDPVVIICADGYKFDSVHRSQVGEKLNDLVLPTAWP